MIGEMPKKKDEPEASRLRANYRRDPKGTVDVSSRHSKEVMDAYDQILLTLDYKPSRSAHIARLVEEFVKAHRKK